MSRHDQLEFQLEQIKEDLNIEEVNFKEVHSQWESDISDDIYSDFFDSDIFIDDINNKKYKFEEGSIYYKKAQKAVKKQAR